MSLVTVTVTPRPAISQGRQAFTIIPNPPCHGCNLSPCHDCSVVAFGEEITTGLVGISGGPTRVSRVFAVFDAYAITSIVQSGSSCITVSGSTTDLPSAFSVLRPFSSYNETQFMQSAKSEFLDALRISACSAEVISAGLVQVVNATATPQLSTLSSSPVSSNSLTSLTFTAALPSSSISSVSSPRIRTKIITGTTIPISLMALLILGNFCWRKYRVGRRVSAAREKSFIRDDIAPFFQQKAELHGDQCRHEMEDEHRRQEMQAEEMRHEMLVDETRLGLEGDHCRHELEAPPGQ